MLEERGRRAENIHIDNFRDVKKEHEKMVIRLFRVRYSSGGEIPWRVIRNAYICHSGNCEQITTTMILNRIYHHISIDKAKTLHVILVIGPRYIQFFL